MLRKDHLYQLIPNRLDAALRRLAAAIWVDKREVPVEASEPVPVQMSLAEGKKQELAPVAPRSYWGRQYDQRWCRVTLPQAAGKNTWLHWYDQGEATLYVNDQPYFGFNVAHRYCRLPKGVREVWVQSSCIQSAIWHPDAKAMQPGGSFFEEAYVTARDEEAWAAYHDLKCLVDVAQDLRHGEDSQAPVSPEAFGLQPPMNTMSPVLRILFQGMNDAVDAYDLEGIGALRRELAALYDKVRVDKSFARCVLTGHAHLDLVWIWPERMSELKAVNIFATANRLMDEYPEFRFAYSQPASYEAVEKREPEFYKQVEKRIRSKRWQATGAMYVESDTMLACGEALARSFLLGQEGFRRINGQPSRLTWLPDVFGYCACLPQIMSQTGVDYFFTTKMTWNAVNRFPYSSFIWRGNDGSQTLVHVTQESGYVTHMTVPNVRAPMNANLQAAIHPEYLLPTGYGDGGGGVTDEMLERARRLGDLPGMPSITWDHPEAFFERLESVREQLPIHQGECYLEYHRGTSTTHANLKATFRKLERELQLAEAVATATGKRLDCEHAWKRLVFAQFHDYIPGSSVWDVYLEGLPELEAEAAGQREQALRALTSDEGGECLFNPHGVDVHAWVKVESAEEPVFVHLPALSGTPVAEALAPLPSPVKIKGKSVSNGLVELRLNASGWIDHLVWDGVNVPMSEPLGKLVIYPDYPANFEAWDIDRHTLSLGEVCSARAEITPVVEGEHRAGFRVTRKVGKNSTASLSFMLEGGSGLVHIGVELDWQEPMHLLKLLFPTGYGATNARFGIPYGSVLRGQVSDSLRTEAMWEVPFSRYLAVFDEGEREGLFLVSEAKYGATVRDGAVGVSLVRSPTVTGYDGHSAAWSAELSRLETPGAYSDLGTHHIRLAVGCYDTELPLAQQPASLADTLFTPPMFYTGEALPPVVEALEGANTLVPCWAKPCVGGDWILRLHEVGGRRGVLGIRMAEGWSVGQTTIGEDEVRGVGDRITFKPYEVVSLRFSRVKE
ncbi:alpha-mannosidase [Ruficoccus amylovorans]|uniref:Alpha-mannosidase n=1 Tax=Ruficoccus amylovorans TaxID=1804625 RepID=A0A842HHW3_9BACT|nr:alpha-mannosidase [Ruficoccus amylovorans]MBC2595588.1 alpha-mannosidase [Ruficoccus amylovorans]